MKTTTALRRLLFCAFGFLSFLNFSGALAQTTRVEGTWRNTTTDGSYNSNIGTMAARGGIRWYRNQTSLSSPDSTTRTLLLNSPGNGYSPKWVASNSTTHIVDSKISGGLISGGSNDYVFNVRAGKYYTIISGNGTSGNLNIAILKTAFNPVAISSISQSPSGSSVSPGQSVTITVNTAAAPSTGEFVYVRYSTDAFATTNNAVQVTMTGSSGTAVIPGTTDGKTTSYYVFTSNQNNTQIQAKLADIDYYTLNSYAGGVLNSTSNPLPYYTYLSTSNLWTTAAAGNWSTGSTWVGGVAPTASTVMGSVVLNHATTLDFVPNAAIITANANLTLSSLLKIPASGTLTVASGCTLNPSTGGLRVLNNGNVSVSSGGVLITSTATLPSGGIATASGGSITVAGGVFNINNAITDSGTVSATSGNINVNAAQSITGTLTNSGGTITLGADLTIASTGTLNVNSGTFSLNGKALNLNGTSAGTGSITGSSSSDLIVGGTGGLTLPIVSGGLRDLTIGRTGTATVLMAQGTTNLIINRNITINSGNTLSPSGNDSVYLSGSGGTFTNNGILLSTAGAGNNFYWIVNGTKALAGSATAANFAFYKLFVASGGLLKGAASGTANIGLQYGTLTVKPGGTIDFSAATSGGGVVNFTPLGDGLNYSNTGTIVFNDFNINSGITFTPLVSGTISIAGNLNGTGTLNTSAVSPALSLVFKGSSLQSITNSTTLAVNNLTINNSLGSGVRAVALGCSVTVNGNLTITSGKLDLNGNNNITLAGASSALSETSGNIIYNSGSPTAGNGYILATAAVNNTTGNPGSLGAKVTTTVNLGTVTVKRFHTARSLGSGPGFTRYYDIKSGTSGAATILFSYDPSELNGITEGSGNYMYTSSTESGTYGYTAATDYNTGVYPRTVGTSSTYTLGSTDLFITVGSAPILYETIANGDINDPTIWFNGTVPPVTAAVTLKHNVTVAVTDATFYGVTISTGTLSISSGRTLTLNTSGFITNNSSSGNLGAGTLAGLGSFTINGSTANTLNNLTANGSISIGTAPTINGILTIKAGGSLSAAPIYTSGSALVYNTGVSQNRGAEWSAGTGTANPYTVQVTGSGTVISLYNGSSAALQTRTTLTIDAGATLNMGAATQPLTVNGDLTNNGTISLSTVSGGDLYLMANYIQGNTATFTHNTRAIFFTSGVAQTLTVTGGGKITAGYLRIQKTAGDVILGPNTNMDLNVSSGNIVKMTGTGGDLDLGGDTLTLSGTAGNFFIKRTQNIKNGVLRVTNGVKTVYDSAIGTNKAAFASNLLIHLNNGLDFGAGISSVDGTLKISSGGYVSTNPPTYNATATLEYANGGNYNRSNEWKNGVNPHNIKVSSINTDLHLSVTSDVALTVNSLNINGAGSSISMDAGTHTLTVLDDITINTGTELDLSTASGGDLLVGGNFIDNGNLYGNGRSVTFNGTGDQTISGSATPFFQYLDINKASGTFYATAPLAFANNGAVSELRITSGKASVGTASITTQGGTTGLLRVTGGQLYVTGNTWYNTFARFSNSTTNTDQADKGALGGEVIVTGTGSLPAIAYNKLTLDGTAVASLAGNASVTGTLTVTSGGEFAFGSSTSNLSAKAAVVNNGTFSESSTSAGALLLNGAASQAVSGYGTYNKVTLNNAAGAVLNGIMNITDLLTVTSGNITMGVSDAVVLGTFATLAESFGSTDSYVKGQVTATRTLTTAAESFGGLGLTVGSGAAAGTSITVTRTSGTEPTGNGGTFTEALQRTWAVSAGSGANGRTLTLGWPSSDDNGVNTTNLQVWRSTNSGSTWSSVSGIYNAVTAAVAPQERSIVSNALTAYGLFTVAEHNVPNLNITTNTTVSGYYGNVTMSSGLNVTLGASLTIEGTLTVPAGTTFITGTNNVSGQGTFRVDSGATLQVAEVNGIDAAGVTGAIRTGVRSLSTGATYVFNGTAAQNTGNGLPSAHVRNLTLNNAAGVTLGSNLAVSNTLTVSQGNFNLNNLTLTLQSSAAGTANLAQLTTGTLSNAGHFTAQRWLDPSASRSTGPNSGAYYWVGSPVLGKSVLDWQQSGNTYYAGTFDNSDPRHGSVWLYNNADNTTPDNGGWVKPSSSSVPAGPGTGVRVWFSNNFFTNGATTSLQGTPVTGTYSLNVTRCTANCAGGLASNGWNLVANPYPSAIDWSSNNWAKNNMDGAVYVYRSGQTAYSTWIGGVGVNGGSNLIASGQAFMVKATAAPAVLTANEGIKVSGNPSMLRDASIDVLRLTLASNGVTDEVAIALDAAASAAFNGSEDAYKFKGSLANLWVKSSAGDELSISRQPLADRMVIIAHTAAGEQATLTLSDVSAIENQGYSLVDEFGMAYPVQTGFTHTFIGTGTDQTFLLVRSVQGIQSAGLARIALMPNPSNGAFSLTSGAELHNVALFNSIGQNVYSQALSGTNAKVEVSVPAGVYSGRIETAEGTQTRKLVIE